MCYTLRDPVSAGTFPTAVEKKPRGKAQRMEIKSRCFDACLVIDGSLSYKFNDGTRAIISIHDEDVLRTVHIYSSEIWKTESTWIIFPILPYSFLNLRLGKSKTVFEGMYYISWFEIRNGWNWKLWLGKCNLGRLLETKGWN